LAVTGVSVPLTIPKGTSEPPLGILPQAVQHADLNETKGWYIGRWFGSRGSEFRIVSS
jgi:hypothetical protein